MFKYYILYITIPIYYSIIYIIVYYYITGIKFRIRLSQESPPDHQGFS